MITVDVIRDAFAEAQAGTQGRKPVYLQWLARHVEYLIPTKNDDLPIFIRCRMCDSLELSILGPADSMPDANQPLRYHVPSFCGHCKNVCMIPNETLAGIREAHRQGRRLGMGGETSKPEPAEGQTDKAEKREGNVL